MSNVHVCRADRSQQRVSRCTACIAPDSKRYQIFTHGIIHVIVITWCFLAGVVLTTVELVMRLVVSELAFWPLITRACGVVAVSV